MPNTTLKPSEVSDILLGQLKDMKNDLQFEEIGKALQVSDGVVRIYGLKNAEADAMTPLREKLSAALAKVAQERGLAFILNTDGDALPYVDSTQGEDVTEYVKREFTK